MLRTRRLVWIAALLAGYLLLAGCSEPGGESNEPPLGDDIVTQPPNDRHLEAVEAEATNRADYESDRERDAWMRHLDDVFAVGEDYASDPTATDDPANVDCDDFAFQEEAEAFFRGAGGPSEDIFILDDDGDGIACELLPAWYPGVDWSPHIRLP